MNFCNFLSCYNPSFAPFPSACKAEFPRFEHHRAHESDYGPNESFSSIVL